jgi:hypothetical protein
MISIYVAGFHFTKSARPFPNAVRRGSVGTEVKVDKLCMNIYTIEMYFYASLVWPANLLDAAANPEDESQ